MSETISKLRDRNKVRTYYRDLNQKTIGSRLITYCLNFPDFLRFHNRDFIPKYTNVGCNTTPPPGGRPAGDGGDSGRTRRGESADVAGEGPVCGLRQ